MYDQINGIGSEGGPAGCGPLLPGPGGDTKPLRQQVFEHVRAAGHTARADVARALGISAGSVTTLTSDLIAVGLLREVDGNPRESREPNRGRPPVALEVVQEGRNVIGIKLSDERHSAVLTDFAGNTLAEATLPTPPIRKTEAQILDEMGALIDALTASAGIALSGVTAVGIGLSGLVDHDTGMVPWSPLLADRDLALKPAFEARFGLPVHVDNDANVLTLAELWFGAGRAMSDFEWSPSNMGLAWGWC